MEMKKHSNKYIPPGLQYLTGNVARKDNIMGSSAHDRASWAAGLSFSENYDTIFFAGCGYQYSAGLDSLMSIIRGMDKSPLGIELPARLAGSFQGFPVDPVKIAGKLAGKDGSSDSRVLVQAAKIVQAAGYDIAYMSEKEPCCGGILYYSGMENVFIEKVKTAYAAFKTCGVKNIISIVPSCTYTLRSLFPKYIDPFDIKVVHILEAVAEKIEGMKLQLPSEITVTYHDPCQLSRFLQITDEPRRILRSIKGINLVEPENTHGERSTCCGGGGGFEAVFPELSEKIACNRAGELAATGAEIIVTHCPGCILQIRHALKKMKMENIKVMDIMQIIAMAMGL